ncbi:MAG: hypothetical protein FD145_1020 [Candidatus Saganbacteria bacterium]|uniref:Uncharacterized protein n=1 Tax=Candidatus Saganbacteria bacterium TaxID=2575572 RepID=A0A833NRU3_UNCSA|nr:MAG: hypothetical protein FD145_1020 [Candidatus Saganbacteria bacterium]
MEVSSEAVCVYLADVLVVAKGSKSEATGALEGT